MGRTLGSWKLLLCVALCLATRASSQSVNSQQQQTATSKADDSSGRIAGSVPVKAAPNNLNGYGYGEEPAGAYYPGAPEPECPEPQSADAVDEVYYAHLTFEWAQLAEEYPAWLAAAQSASRGMPQQPRAITHPTKKRGDGGSSSTTARRVKQPRTPNPAPAPAATGADGGKDAGQPTILTKPAAASAAGAQAAPSAAAASAAAKAAPSRPSAAAQQVKARPAAVTNPSFLLPTNRKESGEGFEGTYAGYPRWYPTDEALAVGPHPQNPEYVLALHGVNSAREIFVATVDGKRVPSSVLTKIQAEQIMQKMGFNTSDDGNLHPVDVQAFYDRHDHRYVMVWSSAYFSPPPANASAPHALLFVCASADSNPLGSWTCWALSALMATQPYVPFCAGRPVEDFLPDYPQASYSTDGIFINILGFCYDADYTYGFASALYALPKKTLYSRPSNDARDLAVFRATYLPSSSWYRSLPVGDQLLTFDPDYPSDNAFNTALLPSRPQSVHDVHEPYFVMGKVDGNLYMSIARLTSEPLGEMDSRQNAPRIYATVLRKGFDFRNTPGYPDGDAVIPQATHHRGKVYVATTEFFGAGEVRTPSIYWAIVDPSHKLCTPSKLDYGVVASEAGLSLAYPVIVARHEGALLAYAYGGAGNVQLNGKSYPAYAGAATTVVGCKDRDGMIDVVQRGTALVNATGTRWGDFSAAEVIDGVAWFAVPAALDEAWPFRTWIFAQEVEHSS